MTSQRKRELLQNIKDKLVLGNEAPVATQDELSLLDDLIRQETSVKHTFNDVVAALSPVPVDPWCLVCATHGHTEKPVVHDERRREMDLKAARELMDAYEEDPYEYIEATWIGRGSQVFYRDKLTGAIHVSSDGHYELSENNIQHLKDIRVLEVKKS